MFFTLYILPPFPRFTAAPIHGLQWLSEREVFHDASLEWACWVLQFLLNDGQDIRSVGAVHNTKVFDALVRYLRTPGAPYKGRIISLLTQLLQSPELFPPSALPNVKTLETVEAAAVVLCVKDREDDTVTCVAPRLQALMEALCTARLFSRSLVPKSEAVVDTIYTLPPQFSSMFNDTIVNLMETVDMMNWLNAQLVLQNVAGSERGDELAVDNLTLLAKALWISKTEVFVNVLDLYAGEDCSGVVTIPGAQEMMFFLDPRTNLKESELRLSNSDGSTIPTDAEMFAGDTLKWHFAPNNSTKAAMKKADSSIHVAFYVFPKGMNDGASQALLAAMTVEEQNALLCASNDTRITKQVDMAIVEVVNRTLEGGLSWPSDCPSFHFPVDLVLKAGGVDYPALDGVPEDLLRHRFAVLKLWNRLLDSTLRLVHLLTDQPGWSFGARLKSLSHLIFANVKNGLFQGALDSSRGASRVSLTLDRALARLSRETMKGQIEESKCLFVQSFKFLHNPPPVSLRSNEQTFMVRFKGEKAQDAGGPYREAISEIVEDLFGDHFALFIKCPNAQQR